MKTKRYMGMIMALAGIVFLIVGTVLKLFLHGTDLCFVISPFCFIASIILFASGQFVCELMITGLLVFFCFIFGLYTKSNMMFVLSIGALVLLIGLMVYKKIS